MYKDKSYRVHVYMQQYPKALFLYLYYVKFLFLMLLRICLFEDYLLKFALRIIKDYRENIDNLFIKNIFFGYHKGMSVY